MKLTITELFCEIVSGLALILLSIPILLKLSVVNIDQVVSFIGAIDSLSDVTIAVLLTYLLGILFDPVGMLFDKLIFKAMPNSNVTALQFSEFYKSVTQPTMDFWNETWAYYFCYRNLFVLVIPTTGFWVWQYWSVINFYFIVIIILAILFVKLSLWITMRDLLRIYYDIPRSFAE